MEALRALAAKKAAEVKEATGSGNAVFSKAQLDESRLKRIREEEAREREEKVTISSSSSVGSLRFAVLWGMMNGTVQRCSQHLPLNWGSCMHAGEEAQGYAFGDAGQQ